MPNEESVREIDKVLLIVTNPEIGRVYEALLLAQGALLAGKAADVMFAASGIAAVTKNSMDDLGLTLADEPGYRVPDEVDIPASAQEVATHLVREGMGGLGMPTVEKFLKKVCDTGGFVYVSKASLEQYHLSREDLWDGVKAVLPMAAYYKHASERTQIIFL